MRKGVFIMSSNIFIFGIERRAGTNFLGALLKNYQGSIYVRKVGEDYLIHPSDKLFEYVDSVVKKWNPKWRSERASLIKSISNGLLQFLDSSNENKVCITKTPSTKNIQNCYTLFPDSYIVIIIRDGRDLAESAKRSFNWIYEYSFRKWADSAKRILNFMNEFKDAKAIIIKYEDLHANTEKEITRLLDFCSLDNVNYDFSAIKNLPVIGSSTYRRDGEVNWEPRVKDQSFSPLDKTHAWSKLRHYRFNKVCGKYAQRLGYELEYNDKTIIYWIHNFFLDLYFKSFAFIYNKIYWLVGDSMKKVNILPQNAPSRIHF
jgi:hypothetical protein